MGGKGSGGHNRRSASRHLRDGTFRPDRHGIKPCRSLDTIEDGRRESGQAGVQVTKVPPWLKGKARAAWKEFAEHLRELGLLTALDRPAFEVMCVTYGRWREAEDDVHANGITYETTTASGSLMRRKNPAVEVAADAEFRLRSLMGKFGLFPSDRIDGYDPRPLTDEEREEDEFFGGPPLYR